MFGVFVHDAQFYDMATLSAVMPTEAITASVNEVDLLKNSQHIHPVVGSFSNSSIQQTAIQPRNDNDKKYVSQRRRIGNTFDNGYSWPSIWYSLNNLYCGGYNF